MGLKITPWLSELVTAELRAVIQWKTLVKQEPDVAHVHEGRFNDDGSNFRCSITSPTLGEGSKLQITNVVSTGDVSVVLVSDGVTQLRAFLSDDAIAVLEEEMGSPLELGMKGDLFIVSEMTIISTPWGAQDKYIQIHVDELEYVGHLRKALGNPTPIEQNTAIEGLITDIGDFRRKQNAAADTIIDESLLEGSVSPDAMPPSSQVMPSDPTNGQLMQQSHKRQRSRSVSPVALTQCPSQGQIFTQATVTAKVRSVNATLRRDGFEMEPGVNLSGPRKATAAHPTSSTSTSSLVSSQKKVRLLNLLDRKDAIKSDRHRHEQRSGQNALSESVSVIVTERTSNRIEPDSTLQRLKINELPNPISVDKESSPVKIWQKKAGQVQSPVNKPTQHTQPPKPVNVQAAIPPAEQSSEITDIFQAHEGQFAPGTLMSDDIWEGELADVPPAQQVLLSDPSCWIPSHVGRQLPVPNVPVELIRQWRVSQDSGKAAQISDRDGSSSSETSSEDDNNDSLSTDEPIPKDQWPSSPMREPLPPDSTLEDRSNITYEDCKSGRHHIPPHDVATESAPVRGRTPRSGTWSNQSATQSILPSRSPAVTSQIPNSTAYMAYGSARLQKAYSSQDSSHRSSQTPPSTTHAPKSRPPNSDGHPVTHTTGFAASSRPETASYGSDSGGKLASQANLRHDQSLPDDKSFTDSNSHRSNTYFGNISRQFNGSTRSVDLGLSSPIDQDRPSTRCNSPVSMHPEIQVPLPPPLLPGSVHISSPRHHLSSIHHPSGGIAQSQIPLTPDRVMVKSTQRFSNDDDDIEMDVPMPLEDPAIAHRKRRRQHFNSSRGQNVQPSKPVIYQDLSMNESRRGQPKDQPMPSQRPSYRDEGLAPLLQASLQKAPSQSSPTTVHPSSGLPSTVTNRDQNLSAHHPRQPSLTAVKRQTPLVDLTQDIITHGQRTVDTMQTSNDSTGRRSSLPQRQSHNVDSRVRAQEQSSSEFQEFAKGWSNVRPGGAFAPSPQEIEQHKTDEKWKVDVMSWGWD